MKMLFTSGTAETSLCVVLPVSLLLHDPKQNSRDKKIREKKFFFMADYLTWFIKN
jgi:hypothetical protein